MALRLTAASDCTDATLARRRSRWCARPAGRPAPAELPFTLPPGEHLEADVVADDAGARRARPVSGAGAARSSPAPTVPAAWRQVVEDVCVVAVGGADDGGLVYLVDEPADVELAAGDSAG